MFGLWRCERLELALVGGVWAMLEPIIRSLELMVMLFIPKITSIFSASRF